MTDRTGPTNRSIRRASMPEVIVAYLTGTEPEKIARVDPAELLNDPNTWSRPETLCDTINGLFTDVSPLWRMWIVDDVRRQLVLGDRFGIVYAHGIQRRPETVCYLLVTTNGLAFHPPIEADKIKAFGRLHTALDDSFEAAMENELPVITHLIATIHEILPGEPDDETHMHLRVLRLARWELDALHHIPSDERAVRIATMLGKLTAIVTRAGFEIEDVLADTRKKIASA